MCVIFATRLCDAHSNGMSHMERICPKKKEKKAMTFISFFFVPIREFPVGTSFFFFFICSYKGVPCWYLLYFSFYFVLMTEFPVGTGFFFFFFFL